MYSWIASHSLGACNASFKCGAQQSRAPRRPRVLSRSSWIASSAWGLLLRNFRQPTLLPPLVATRPGQPSAGMLLIGVLACAVPPLVTSPLTGTILANGLFRHHCGPRPLLPGRSTRSVHNTPHSGKFLYLAQGQGTLGYSQGRGRRISSLRASGGCEAIQITSAAGGLTTLSWMTLSVCGLRAMPTFRYCLSKVGTSRLPHQVQHLADRLDNVLCR
jgi:hypothetical protein